MKAIDKNQLLDALENKVERHIQDAVEIFQNTDDRTLLQPAADGGWSIAQCLAHLNSYGDYYLPQIQNGLNKPVSPPVSEKFQSSWLGAYFTRLMDPETGKKKQKAFKNHIPTPNLDAYAVVAEFIQQQETLLAYLQQARQTDLNKIKIPISIMKWLKLKLGDVFQFLIAHNERHMVQAKRNLVPQPGKVSA